VKNIYCQQAASNYVHMGVNHDDGIPTERFWVDYSSDFAGKNITITLSSPSNSSVGNHTFTFSKLFPTIEDANGLESTYIEYTPELKSFLATHFDSNYNTQDSNIHFDVSIDNGVGTIVEGDFTFSENKDFSTNTDYVNGWFDIKQPSIFNGLSGQETESPLNFHFTLDTNEQIVSGSVSEILISVNDVPLDESLTHQYSLAYGDVTVDAGNGRVTFRIYGDLKPTDIVKVESLGGIYNVDGDPVLISSPLTANTDFLPTLNSVTYDNDAGELRLEFSEDMIESTTGESLNIQVSVDGENTGSLSPGYTVSGNTITVPASSLGINPSTLTMRSDISVTDISGIRDLQDNEFTDYPTFVATKVGFEPAIIPGGIVGSVTSVAQVVDSSDVRDADQVYSLNEYNIGDYRLEFNFDSVPGYTPNSSEDYVFAVINGQIAGYSSIDPSGMSGIFIDGLEDEYDISAEELRLGSAFDAELEIVIAEAIYSSDTPPSGEVPQIGTVYARTSALDPVILDLQDPAILKDYVRPPVDDNNDGSPGDPLVAAEELVNLPDDFVSSILAGEDGIADNDDDGILVTDVSTGTPSDTAINVIYVNDTDNGNAATYVGSAYTDFIITTTDIVSGDSIEAGDGFDTMYNAFAYDHTNDSSKGLDVDLGYSTVTFNDGSSISLLEAEVEAFSGTHLDDTFYGASGYSSLNGIQGFAPGGGRDYVQGDSDPSTFTIVDYTMDDGLGAQGVVIITQDPAAVSSGIAYSTGNGSDIGEITDYWNDWIPYDETIVERDGYILNESLQEFVGDAVILDHSGFADIVKNVDYYIGTSYADIMIGGNESDIFNGDLGEGNYFDGGGTDDHDILMVENLPEFEHLDIPDGSAIDYDTVSVKRHETSTAFDLDHDGAVFTSTDMGGYTPPQLISYTVIAPQAVIDVLAPESLGDNFDVTAAYEIFASGNIADWSTNVASNYTSIIVDDTEATITINDSPELYSLFSDDYLDLTLVQTDVWNGDFVVTYDSYAFDNDGNNATPDGTTHHSTIIRDVEEVVITEQADQYLPNLASADSYADVSGMFIDSYEYIGAGQGDLGDMLYVTTDQFISGTTGYEAASGFSVAGEIFYSGHHTDFNRNDVLLSNWAGAVAGALGSRNSNLWNEDVAEFFTMHTDSSENTFEVAVIYDTAKQTWRVNNEHFDTFQNVTIDASMASQLSASTGQSIVAGDYRVFYSAAFKDINTVLEGNDGLTVDNWNFSFENFPSIPRSTFYIEVGGETTGNNGDTGALGEALANITAVQVDWDDTNGEFLITRDADGSFPTPLVNLDTFLPTGLDLAADKSDTVIARDISENVKGGLGSDTLFGRGGADTYQIASGEAGGAANVFKNKDGSDIIGDIINEIGGRVSDDGDSVQFIGNTSIATNIGQFSFERTKLRNEDEGNTLKITADYDKDGTVDDTVFLFDQFNEEQPFRQVEQLLLDDGWDPDEAWNLITGQTFNYEAQDGSPANMDWHIGTAGHDVMVTRDTGDSWIDLNGEADLVVLGEGKDTVSIVTDNYNYHVPGSFYNSEESGFGSVNWSEASDSGQIHQILGFDDSVDTIDLSFLGIMAPNEIGADGTVVGIHYDTATDNSYLYQQEIIGNDGQNIKVLAEFTDAGALGASVRYDNDDIPQEPAVIL